MPCRSAARNHIAESPTPSCFALITAPGDHLSVFPTLTAERETAGSISMPCRSIQQAVS
jgi:hypothetical protein